MRLSSIPGNLCIFYFYIKSVGKAPRPTCGMCLGRHQGSCCETESLMRVSKTKKPVSRAYSAPMCAGCVCDTIKQAFLIEKQKIVVKVFKAQVQSESKINMQLFKKIIRLKSWLKKDGIYTFILTFFNSQK